MKPRLAPAVLLAALSSPSLLRADFQYADFATPQGLVLNGTAAQVGDRIRIVEGASFRYGAMWHDVKQFVANGFVTDFTFELDPSVGKGGLAFVIQNASLDEVGGADCKLGYHFIENSVAIEFDSWSDGGCALLWIGDPAGRHISVQTRGTAPNSVEHSASLGSTSAIVNFANGAPHTARIEYTVGTLSVYLDDLTNPVLVVALDLASLLNLDSGFAWVGLTAATGAPAENHDALAWNFTGFGSPTGNHPPVSPTVTEPGMDGQIVNPADVHMESSAFSDPDAGDQHACSDWEIWTVAPVERVWSIQCITGVEVLHIHLGDGVFEGSHTGRIDLLQQTPYVLRVRHRDDSGDALSEWSPWGERDFTTGDASDIFPLALSDVVESPAPDWIFEDGGAVVVLPAGDSKVWLESHDALVLEFAAFDGLTNLVTNTDELHGHEVVRLRADAGSTALDLPASVLTIVDEDCNIRTVLIPRIQLVAAEDVTWWISSSGATYEGDAADDDPDFTTLARGPDPPWIPALPGYEVDVFATGLQLPIHLAFIPNGGSNPEDPFLYVTELYGTIKVISRDGTVGVFASNLLDFHPTGSFPGSGEQGLSGISVDPISGDVFAAMLYDSPTNPGTHFPKVVRFTSFDGGHTAAIETTILDMAGEIQGQSHFISNVTVHPNGTLFVHMGDGFQAATALNLSSFRGKILRMNLDGSPRTDNPFYDASDGIDALDYIFAYGLRNPFGGQWRAADGYHYEVENGPALDRLAKVVAGRNFAWNGDQQTMATHAIYNWQPAASPIALAFVQPETFDGSAFPESKMGHLFVSLSGPTYAEGPNSKGKRIVEFELDASGDVVTGPTPFLEYSGQGRATAAGLAAGPDGLYMTELYRDDAVLPAEAGARILRIRFVGGIDCNGNGVHDVCDVLSGTSPDENQNSVPDECECRGLRFCSATVNSSGQFAAIHVGGSCIVDLNEFVLTATGLPDQFGLFYYGANQLNGGNGIPFFNGLACVDGSQSFRLPPVLIIDGVANYQLDFTDPPIVGGTILPGSAWNFQFWFRDPAGGGTFVNLSDAIVATFR